MTTIKRIIPVQLLICAALCLLGYTVPLTIKSIGGPKYIPPAGYQQVYVGQTFALTNGEVWIVSSMRGSCSMVLVEKSQFTNLVFELRYPIPFTNGTTNLVDVK